MKTDLNYTPGKTFETFPFPQNISRETESALELIGKEYLEFRQQLMLKTQLGLTKIYNLFHNSQLGIINSSLPSKEIEKSYGKETLYLWTHLKKAKDTCSFKEAAKDIFHLRELHKEIDNIVLRAYGWEDIDPAHDFYEIDYLPENDHIRYTISPEARKEVLKRLLKLNHEIYEQEVAEGLHNNKESKKSSKKGKTITDKNQGELL
jgi:hypothetical protein